MKRIPIVVIAGRMNVGKSTLFNRLAERVKSLVLDYAGLTRDTLKDIVTVDNVSFELRDTAGVGVNEEDALQNVSQERAYQEVSEADLVLFLVDGSVGLLSQERAFARMLHSKKIPTLVVVNKIDRQDAYENMHEFHALGFGEPLLISAEHGRGMPQLLDAILERVRTADTMRTVTVEEPVCRIMLLGKPNAGKSSLLNALVGYERALVSDIPGTTREAISERVMYHQQPLDVIDTPGVRKKASVKGPVEPHMVQATFQALTKTDIVLVVVDATEAELSDQVLKLAFYAFDDRYKGVILILTKWDLVTPVHLQKLEDELGLYNHLIKKIPVMRVSSLTGKHVGKVVPLVHKVCQRYKQQLDTFTLYKLFQAQLLHKPLVKNEIHLTVHKVEQVGTAPITLKITVDEPPLWEPSHIGFLERLVRSEYDLEGVPVKFVLVKR